MSAGLKKGLRFLLTCRFDRVWDGIHVRIYRFVWAAIFRLVKPWRCSGRATQAVAIDVDATCRVAFESPDHLAPTGTARDNSTNKKFVLHMDEKLHREFGDQTLRVIDLGCSGGQMVVDFVKLRWIGVGLEGSDYSLKHQRANWKDYTGKNLFTADISKPFQVKLDGKPAKFHLITAWEVMEHFATHDLDLVFNNICKHLATGGYFIASTTSSPDVQKGIELHQTKWENARWREYVEKNFPELEPVDVGLKTYQFVRCNFDRPSFLLYRKKNGRA
jgi:SAM-dependent methyltransferase